MAKNTYYISTPIYYPSDKLHIGHAYTTTAADAVSRFKRLEGKDVLFVTGSDEHGQKIEKIAKEKGKAPIAYVDEIVATFKDLWERLNISYDEFVRTTESRHEKVVQEIFMRAYKNGDIYKSRYKGWYCTPCENFLLERQLDNAMCPDCGRPVEMVEEESYFFKMSKYQDRLLKHIKENPNFIKPESRKHEMLNFIESGLEDLCISRTTFDWGIPVPLDENHVIYVWFDALSNYLTGAGFLQDEEKYSKYWPAQVHLVGKEIVRFHTIIWPIMLMSAGLELPDQIFGHGWLIIEGDKMSKSKGNVVDPILLIDEFSADAIRYFLLREITFGVDGNFSRDALIQRINADLANDLGNLLSRTVAMTEKYFDGVVPEPEVVEDVDQDLKNTAVECIKQVSKRVDNLELNDALRDLWVFVSRTNKYIDQTQPWILGKDESKKGRLATVLYNLIESLRLISLLTWPFMPDTGQAIWEQIGLTGNISSQNLGNDGKWGQLKAGTKVIRGKVLFPRIDIESADSSHEKSNQSKPGGKSGSEEKNKKGNGPRNAPNGTSQKSQGADVNEGGDVIDIDDFAKVDLRVAEVLGAEKVKGADRLLKLLVKVGSEERTLVAGVAQHYEAEALIGKKVIIVANLKPAKIRGVKSQGMVLAASDKDGNLSLLTVDKDMESGSEIR